MRLVQASIYSVIVTVILSFALAIPAKAGSFLPNGAMQPEFYAKGSRLATLQFKNVVQLRSNVQPDEKMARQQAEKQVAFMFGALSSNLKKGSPKRDHTIEVTDIEKLQNNLYSIHFKYLGTIQVEGTLLSIELPLPVDPDTIHAKASRTEACLDLNHPEAEYYWYFFDPKIFGCGLQAGVDYTYIKGSLKYKSNTVRTYPEYERLVQDGQISINVIFGMDDSSLDWNPMLSKDLNAPNYRRFRSAQLNQGYKSKVLSDKEIADLIGESYDTPYIEELIKDTPKGTLKIQIYFGGIGDILFNRYFALSLKTASVMVYDGHSGLGKYLDIKEIERSSGLKIEMPKDQYQIVFWNGCSSFPYYNQMYFDLKITPQDPIGTKNMDAIANGLSTLFTAIEPSVSILVNAVDAWATGGRKVSYQEIIRTADSDNLLSISGDEDNEN